MLSQVVVFLMEFSICLVAFVLLFELLLRREKCHRFNRFYLLSIPILSLMITGIPDFHWNIGGSNISELPQFYYSINLVNQVGSQLGNQLGQIDLVSYTFRWTYLIVLFYLIGLGYNFFRIGKGLYLFHQFSKQVGGSVENGIKKIHIKGLESPFSMFQTIVLPLNHQSLEQIEKHEISHCQHKHTWDIIYFEVLGAILWFHPIIYILKKLVKEQHEYQADSDVIRDYQSKILYASALVEQSRKLTNNIIPYANHFHSLTIKNRLKMIAKKENQKITFLKTALSLPLVIVLLLTFSIQFECVAQDNAAPKEKQYVTIGVGKELPAAEKEEMIQRIIKENKAKGIDFDRTNIIFKIIEENENSLLMEALTATDPLPNPPSGFQFKLDKSSRQVKVFLNGKEVEVYVYTLSFTKEVSPDRFITKSRIIRGYEIPDEFVFGNDYEKVIVGEFILGKDGKNKSYNGFYHEITNDCN